MPVVTQRRSARQLEAAGAAEVTFEFRGTPVTIPLAIEAWPLDAIRAGVLGRALKALLGRQRVPMRTRDDALELSHRMADACGITPVSETPADLRLMFGAVPILLNIVDNHGDDLEADLRRFYGLDYRDPGACTLRQVWVMVRRLPPESALVVSKNGGELPWTRGEQIAAKSWEMWTQKRFPGRPPMKAELDEYLAKAAAEQAHMARDREREAYYASGQNMRDAGIDTTGMSFPADERPPQQDTNESDPVSRALAVAKRNARRTPRKGSTDGRRPAPDATPGFRGGRWDNAGSGW